MTVEPVCELCNIKHNKRKYVCRGHLFTTININYIHNVSHRAFFVRVALATMTNSHFCTYVADVVEPNGERHIL